MSVFFLYFESSGRSLPIVSIFVYPGRVFLAQALQKDMIASGRLLDRSKWCFCTAEGLRYAGWTCLGEHVHPVFFFYTAAE